MAFDLFKGLTKRNWAREPNRLLTVPVPSAARDVLAGIVSGMITHHLMR